MITGKQRSYLKKLGHELEPVVYIGKSDMTENVIKEMDNLLCPCWSLRLDNKRAD